jgi:hypothetical protein
LSGKKSKRLAKNPSPIFLLTRFLSVYLQIMAFSQNDLKAPKAHPERVKRRDDEKRRQQSQCLSQLRVLRERSRCKKTPQRLNIKKIGGFGKKARKFLP